MINRLYEERDDKVEKGLQSWLATLSLDNSAMVGARVLYKDYRAFIARENMIPVSERTWGQFMCVRYLRTHQNGRRFYRGLRVPDREPVI